MLRSGLKPLRSRLVRIARAVRAIDDCWIGDVIGALSLGGLAWFLSLFLMVIK